MNSCVERSIRNYQMVAIGLLLMTLSTLASWTAFAKLAGAVIAPAVISVDGNSNKVQHLYGGIIADVMVKDGTEVTVGDALLKLDATEDLAKITMLRSELNELHALRARLSCERDACPTTSHDLQPSTEQERDGADQAVWADQERLMKARKQVLDAKTTQLHERLLQVEQNRKGLAAQQESIERQLELIRKELALLRRLEQKQLVTQNRILTLEREEQRLLGENGRLRSEIDRSLNIAHETRLQLAELQERFLSDVLQNLREVDSKIVQTREQEKVLQRRLELTTVRAPVTGFVHNLIQATRGAVIKPGELIAEIVPKEAELIINAHVDPHMIDRVAVGQDSIVRFTTFDQRTTPELKGRVSMVSADAKADSPNSRPYYTVNVRLAVDEVEKLGAERLRPGMPAELHILSAERTVIAYLVKPFWDQVARAMRER